MTLAAAARRVREDVLMMATGPEGAHVGGSLSAAEILVALYFGVMRLRPEDPRWPERDYFILSKGHASAAFYATLAARGFLPAEELATYAQPGSRLAGHPSRDVPGVEFPTGSLGHGLALGLGLALAAKRDEARNRCFVLLGDGELQEGTVWEAALTAGSLMLDNLVAIVDRNGLQINGPTERRAPSQALSRRWESFGWVAHEVDGHDLDALVSTLSADPIDNRPTVVIANTVKGRGVSFMENRRASHYVKLTPTTYRRALRALEESR